MLTDDQHADLQLLSTDSPVRQLKLGPNYLKLMYGNSMNAACLGPLLAYIISSTLRREVPDPTRDVILFPTSCTDDPENCDKQAAGSNACRSIWDFGKITVMIED